ncbi:MAG: SMC-Scp complex subunit ScpB [Candidatus Marinimicrobia bacterium]|nr:SMC-Scp complex subunit ScpB [Candidatus Neomarinimicrobiota bacterium]
MTEAMIDLELLQITELLLTASPEPLTPAKFNQVMDGRGGDLETIITQLNDRFEQQARPVEIVHVAGGYQLVSRPEHRHYLQKLHQKSGRLALSRAALETIAVVAYKQPITRGDIEQIRGVSSGSVLRTLLERGLVTVKGRDEGPGRPLLYGTTSAFLQAFGLAGLRDLPKLREINEIMGEGEAPEAVADAAE